MFEWSPLRRWSSACLLASVLTGSEILADQALRVATWNILTAGEPGSDQYEAAYAVLARLGADVVAVQEVASAADATYLVRLAVDLGYPHVTVAPAGPFGALRTAVMSDFDLVPGISWTAAALSGDPQANDITRYILQADVDIPGDGEKLSVIVTHWKSGSTMADAFRRVIESQRVAQVVDRIAAPAQPYVLMGDVNADIRDGPLTPTRFNVIPPDLPSAFVTGADIRALITAEGLVNDPFFPLLDKATMVAAAQVDADQATRPASGRRLDYLLTSDGILTQGAQVYDCADEALLGGLPLLGTPLAVSVCPTASDHLPVFADLVILTEPTTPPFADVPQSSWAYHYIHAIRDAGITTGCGNNHFCPQAPVTREQMAAFLIRALEYDHDNGYCVGSSPFHDVQISSYYCGNIKRLAELAITRGCGNGHFCPGDKVTREQMAVFIIRALEGDPTTGYCQGTHPFNDVPASSWACGHIKRLVEEGITQGCGNGDYCPNKTVTREQMAAFLARAFLSMD